jgi:Cu-Zn family superoxide dismutase
MSMRTASSLAALLACGLSACVFVHATDTSPDGAKHTHGSGTRAGPRASARIEGRSGSSLTGTASFSEQSGGVLVELSVTNAPPGWHAVHVHEKGDCSAADGSSAGTHFNPAGHKHGSPHAAEHHAGDLGNMWVDEHGNGRHVLLMPVLAVTDGPNSVRGRALIVHAAADDLVTDPTGNAGGRIGCGVIQ